jgi:hypothetical protein
MVPDITGGRSGIHDEEILATNGRIHGQIVEILREAGRREA